MRTRGADAAILGDEALPNEHVIWVGDPVRGLFLYKRDLWAVPCPLLLAAGWMYAAWDVAQAASASGDYAPLAWLIALIATATYISLGRLVVDAWLRSRTSYVITDQRVIIRKGGGVATSIPISSIRHLAVWESRNGFGTISFCDKMNLPGPLGDSIHACLWRLSPFSTALIQVPNALNVSHLICDVRSQLGVVPAVTVQPPFERPPVL